MREDILTNDPERVKKAVNGLYNVIDPEIGLNIVDLGLVYQIDFIEKDKRLNLIMTLTTQFCPMGDAITSDATQALQHEYPDWLVVVDLVFDPAWDYSKISPEGNEYLGR
jgi:metal-sulfur cluster biosynthetic enzyme